MGILRNPRIWRAFHCRFYLAMALWGKAGEPHRECCSQALLAFQKILDTEGDPLDPALFQMSSLLAWGAGDTARAANDLDLALDALDLVGSDIEVSYWTFRETTPREFRQDCEEMRRMIQGEPIRPAFLGSPKGK